MPGSASFQVRGCFCIHQDHELVELFLPIRGRFRSRPSSETHDGDVTYHADSWASLFAGSRLPRLLRWVAFLMKRQLLSSTRASEWL